MWIGITRIACINHSNSSPDWSAVRLIEQLVAGCLLALFACSSLFACSRTTGDSSGNHLPLAVKSEADSACPLAAHTHEGFVWVSATDSWIPVGIALPGDDLSCVPSMSGSALLAWGENIALVRSDGPPAAYGSFEGLLSLEVTRRSVTYSESILSALTERTQPHYTASQSLLTPGVSPEPGSLYDGERILCAMLQRSVGLDASACVRGATNRVSPAAADWLDHNDLCGRPDRDVLLRASLDNPWAEPLRERARAECDVPSGLTAYLTRSATQHSAFLANHAAALSAGVALGADYGALSHVLDSYGLVYDPRTVADVQSWIDVGFRLPDPARVVAQEQPDLLAAELLVLLAPRSTQARALRGELRSASTLSPLLAAFVGLNEVPAPLLEAGGNPATAGWSLCESTEGRCGGWRSDWPPPAVPSVWAELGAPSDLCRAASLAYGDDAHADACAVSPAIAAAFDGRVAALIQSGWSPDE